MRELSAVHVDEALNSGLWWLKTAGEKEDSRNGPVIVALEPVCTTYHYPWNRVSFSPVRDANPFFHLYEAFWMLAGSQNVFDIARFNKRMIDYTDNGKDLHGAYGYRWRCKFGFDQLYSVVLMLQKDPTTRRAVLTMWDPPADLQVKSYDIPCNTHIYFRVRGSELDLTVCCRSNDAVWGAHGANAVHFSILQEFIAGACGLQMGKMFQFSNNYHVYEPYWNWVENPNLIDWEQNTYPATIPLGVTPENWKEYLKEIERFVFDGEIPTYSFLKTVLVPMAHAYTQRDRAILATMPPCDWRVAGEAWFARR